MKKYREFVTEVKRETLYKRHQELRKKAGLPDPSYYTKLIQHYQDLKAADKKDTKDTGEKNG